MVYRGLCIDCRGFVQSVGALYSVLGLCIVRRGFVQSFEASPPQSIPPRPPRARPSPPCLILETQGWCLNCISPRPLWMEIKMNDLSWTWAKVTAQLREAISNPTCLIEAKIFQITSEPRSRHCRYILVKPFQGQVKPEYIHLVRLELWHAIT